MSLYLIYNHDGHKFANRMVIRYTDGLAERASDVTWKCLSDLPRSLVFDAVSCPDNGCNRFYSSPPSPPLMWPSNHPASRLRSSLQVPCPRSTNPKPTWWCQKWGRFGYSHVQFVDCNLERIVVALRWSKPKVAVLLQKMIIQEPTHRVWATMGYPILSDRLMFRGDGRKPV